MEVDNFQDMIRRALFKAFEWGNLCMFVKISRAKKVGICYIMKKENNNN